MSLSFRLWTDVLQLFFPDSCPGCGETLRQHDARICARCSARLPYTGFRGGTGNPVEKVFWGRTPVQAATAVFYFAKTGLLQKLVHDCKYRGRRDLALYLGGCMGKVLQEDSSFGPVTLVVPVPLHRRRQRQRGYNQAALLAEGIAGVLCRPCASDVLRRTKNTGTQTRRSRTARWENMADAFALSKPEAVAGAHILLVDDVLTTGATLDACAAVLSAAPGARLSIATLAYAGEL
ncbi:ComF family protein [Compostibacter hankyongensis]|uniref:ComF family protein n=1 Tax=Compostibacter hankyongensis TaxID=1007089 RepID=A0ABP8G5V0_9BACT